MTKQQEILKRVNILLYQILEAIEDGQVEVGHLKKSTDEIDDLIDSLEKYFK